MSASQRRMLDPCLTSNTKLNSNGIEGLNVRAKALKLFDKNTGERDLPGTEVRERVWWVHTGAAEKIGERSVAEKDGLVGAGARKLHRVTELGG